MGGGGVWTTSNTTLLHTNFTLSLKSEWASSQNKKNQKKNKLIIEIWHKKCGRGAATAGPLSLRRYNCTTKCSYRLNYHISTKNFRNWFSHSCPTKYNVRPIQLLQKKKIPQRLCLQQIAKSMCKQSISHKKSIANKVITIWSELNSIKRLFSI